MAFPKSSTDIEGIKLAIANRKKMLLSMATGTGKTFVAFQVVWKLYQSDKIHKVLYITDRKFLRSSAENVFEPFGDAIDEIIEGKAPKNRDIYFATYQSLYSGEEGNRLYQQYDRDFFDMIIIDECHRSGFGKWKPILDYFAKAVHLGMTATPKRDDNIDTYEYFGEPVYSYSLGVSIEDGFTSPYKIHKVFTNIDAQGGLTLKNATDVGAEIYIPEDVTPKDFYSIGQFERAITLPDRTKRMTQHLCDLLSLYGQMNKTIVFCVSIDHAGEVAKHVQNHFASLGHSDYAVKIVAEEGADIDVHYNNFKDSDKQIPVVATTVDLLSTGVDIPSVKNIVFMKPVASKIVFKQIMGRGSRIDPLTDKYQFRIIDYVNATRLFDEWDRPEKVEEEEERPRKYFLKGTVIDGEEGSPVPNASITVQLAPNEQAAVRTNQFGEFSLANLPPKVQLKVTSTDYSNRSLTTQTYRQDTVGIVVELKKKVEKAKPIEVEGLHDMDKQ